MPTKADFSNIPDYRTALKEREAEIKLLQETFRLVASELDPDKVYQTIADRALQLVEAETLLIPILDSNQEYYIYKAGAGKNIDEIIGETLPIEFGICGWVWKNKRAWWRGVLSDLDEHERNLWEKEAGTLIMVPLQGRRTFLGGIAAINKKDGLDFTRRDMEILSMFANIAAISLENALSFRQLSDTKDMLIEHQRHLERLNKQYSESSKKVQELTLYDSLTGVPNRTLFNDRLKTQLDYAKQNDKQLGLLIIDINNFKNLNDALGHDIGDLILINFCQNISQHISSSEVLGRLGSDEFILLQPDSSKLQIESRALSLTSLFETPLSINKREININACIGISRYPESGTDSGELLRHADIALHHAKDQHLPYHIFDIENDHSSDAQLSLSIDLHEALQKSQFELYYQPKIDIKSNSVIAAEALARWNHPTKGFISPAIFIDALENNNLIDRFTFFAIDQALLRINDWLDKGYNIHVAINISTKTLMKPDFVDQIESRLSDFSLSKRIIFEITESLFFTDYSYVLEVLNRIRSLGITLSIDDFGTGYSSLSRLKQLPVSELKIDQSFIKDMTTNFDDQVIVKSIIDLAHNLGLSVVAEGVETKPILDKLNQLGCDIAQGYLISRPMAADEFEKFLKTF